MKFGIADYGMNVWDGGSFDIEHRLIELKKIGYDGVERVQAISADDALNKAARYRRVGCDFGTCQGPTPETCIQWTAGLGKSYVWTSVSGNTFDTFCRQVNVQIAAAKRWGIHVGIHNHMGSLVETQPQLEEFLARCPEAVLVFDTAHLAAVGGDCVGIVRKYHQRIEVMHLKDWLATDAKGEAWHQKGRFCGLGLGNIGLDNLAVMKELKKVGYDGWVFVEHDTHLQDPFKDLALSREYLRKGGF